VEKRTGVLLDRTTFETSRELEYFSEKELRAQIGHGKGAWPIAILKELIDNALDACETKGCAPKITVVVEKDSFSIQDNGPGIEEEVIKKSLDYTKRVSDKVYYISPTRGQLGNALKTVWAVPFVLDGQQGKVEVFSKGKHYTISVSVDRISQKPKIKCHIDKSSLVKNGSLVKIHVADSAGLLNRPKDDGFYKGIDLLNKLPSAIGLIRSYAAFNPHASFTLNEKTYKATNTTLRKWKPSNPTSPHWYAEEELRNLMAAYIYSEQNGGKPKTVREFVSEFRGISSTAKQKVVTQGFEGLYLHDLVKGDDIDMKRLTKLHNAMKAISNPPKPSSLGAIGKEHLVNWMVNYANVVRSSIQYTRRLSAGSLPHVLEIAFGIRKNETRRRKIVTGLNWTPTLNIPLKDLDELVQEMRLDWFDPVVLVIHIARPLFNYIDRGKTRIEI